MKLNNFWMLGESSVTDTSLPQCG